MKIRWTVHVSIVVFVCVSLELITGQHVWNGQVNIEDRHRGQNSHRMGKAHYSYRNCGDPSKEMVVLHNLTIGPDPIVLPGNVTVSFSGEVKSVVDSPLRATVDMWELTKSGYEKYPCLGTIGSCHFDNLCEMLDRVECPPPFQAHGIPCKCPFEKGVYTLPVSTFVHGLSLIPYGTFNITVNLHYNDTLVACGFVHLVVISL